MEIAMADTDTAMDIDFSMVGFSAELAPMKPLTEPKPPYGSGLMSIKNDDREAIQKTEIPTNDPSGFRIWQDFQGIFKEDDDLPWMSIAPINGNIHNCLASIEGPINSPYDGGVFWIHVAFPNDYPRHPPKANFITPMYHPNVNFPNGQIGIDVLYPKPNVVTIATVGSWIAPENEWRDTNDWVTAFENRDSDDGGGGWSSAMTIGDLLRYILEVVNCPMAYHEYDQPVMIGIANIYQHTGFQTFYENAIFYTKKYADGVRPNTSTAFNEQMAKGLGNKFPFANTFEYPQIEFDIYGIYTPYNTEDLPTALCTNPATDSGLDK